MISFDPLVTSSLKVAPNFLFQTIKPTFQLLNENLRFRSLKDVIFLLNFCPHGKQSSVHMESLYSPVLFPITCLGIGLDIIFDQMYFF